MRQQGKVIAVDQHKIWVDVSRQSACHNCAAKNGCGTSLLERALPNSGSVFELDTGNRYFELGSMVDISMNEDNIVSASLLIYGLPLLSLLIGTIAANAMTGTDLGAMTGAVIGFGLGFFITRRVDTRMAKNLAPTITASKA